MLTDDEPVSAAQLAVYSWAVALDLRKYTVTAQPHRSLVILRRLVYTVTDIATQMRLLSSYGKALTSLLMTKTI